MAALPPKPQPTVAAIYDAYEQKQDGGFRDHLGASIIGNPCNRALWYSFRWATRARHTGRLLRLFETGQLQEARLVSDLRAIGVRVMSVDPDNGEQWRVVDDTGHFGGSMDSVGIGFPEAPKTYHLIEYKTHNLKSFSKLKADGVEKSKPLHFAQMQTYMHLSGLERAFYLAVCKDTDELYQERISADPDFGARIVAKARRIIDAPRPPERISHNRSWHECKFCDHHPVCHDGELPERHCRSCLHSTPVAGGEWHCAAHERRLTPQEQRAGCPRHLFIPDFISGEPIGADEAGGWVEYRMRDGRVWRDEA